jgi:hypothetical protein
MNVLDQPNDTFVQFKQLQHDYIGYQSLTDVPRVLNYHDELKDYSVNILYALRRKFFESFWL